MDEEKQPLLAGPSRRKISVRTEEQSDDSSDSLSIKLGAVKVPIYGTDLASIGRIIPVEERITYTWNEINVFANVTETRKRKCGFFGPKIGGKEGQRKHILKNVSGIAYPGELLAILGTSGAGKTTLLNALTYRSTKDVVVSGTRCVNGVAVNFKALTSVSAYVQQDDLFIGSLTVREHLVFQALVRMDRNISYEQRMKRVEEVIQELGLKKCEKTIISRLGKSGISGGEKKRLSFAAEVLTNPSLMFCDEPTSGLDSFMALSVVQVLRTMAQTGKTVVCTIHQPSSELYAMFDKLLLMSEGRVAFLGTPEQAAIFFTELDAPCPRNYNPADYYIQLLAIVPGREESCRQAVTMICNKYERSDVGIKMTMESTKRPKDEESGAFDQWLSGDTYKSPYKASWCAQFKAVLWRSWISIIKDPLLVKVRIIQTIIVSLVIGAIYYGQKTNQDGVMNINGVLFIYLTNMTFQNVFAVINVFCTELPVFLREHRNGMYRTDVYFLSKTIAEAPLFVFLPILFTSINYYLIGLNPELFRFLVTCGIVTLITNVSTSFGYMISCIANSNSMASSLGPPLIIPFLLFGGFFLNINSIPIYLTWLSYISWFRYGNEALMINQWDGIAEIDCPIGNSTCPRTGQIVLETFNFSKDNFLTDIIALCCLIVGFRLVAFFALLLKTIRHNR